MGAVRSLSSRPDAGVSDVDVFQQRMEELFSVGLAASAPAGSAFHTQGTAYGGKRLRFAALRFCAQTTASRGHGSASSRVLLSLQKEGVAMVSQAGRESRIEPGDMFLIDPSAPLCIETGAMLTHSVYLEAAPLRMLMSEFDTLTARAVSATEGPGALVAGLVEAMFAQAADLIEPVADRIADALPHVLACAFAGLAGTEDRSRWPPRRLHKQRVADFVRDNLRRHELDAAAIARGVGLSTRYLYELFDDEPEPVIRWIWRLRLERCRDDLVSPTLAACSIGEIAQSWGFGDRAHFSRAFRLRFGSAPSRFRAASLTALRA